LKYRKIKRIQHAEKIAAGEVVERPANIVKELVENSIDAGASEIRIIVKRAGKSLIQVIDNGIGIPPEEIEFAFKRHTSSKIRSIEDLDSLSTLGFRGEALASIVAVSQVEIVSRITQNESGIRLVLEEGVVKEKNEISCPVGTNIKVKNIFYNIPARQKFLKSDSTELGHITDILQRYALSYPRIHFIYRHNDLDILNCPAENDLKTTVFHIYGKSNAKYMEYVEDKKNPSFKVYGLLGHPQISKKNRNISSIFINNRYIISDILFRAINDAYSGTLMTSKFPFVVLFLELNPTIIDFNVHPKKIHVRFENDEFIQNKVYNIIRKFVEEKFITKEAKYITTEIEDFIKTPESEIRKIDFSKIERPIKEIRERSIHQTEKVEKMKQRQEGINTPVQLRLEQSYIGTKNGDINTPETFLREKYINIENFPKIKLISQTGQLSNKIYIVLEGLNEETNEEGLYILDQHAASERINKERFLLAFENQKISRQQLISPLSIEVSPSERFFIAENISNINKLGFEFEHFGGNTFVLRSIPAIMGKLPKTDLIQEIISDITEIGKDKSFAEVKEEIINYLSCHKSIRGGDDLTLKDIRNLLNELSHCKDPYHCAHGRPTLKFISFRELDKLFKRIV